MSGVVGAVAPRARRWPLFPRCGVVNHENDLRLGAGLNRALPLMGCDWNNVIFELYCGLAAEL